MLYRMLYRVLYRVLYWQGQVVNARSLVDVVQQSVSRQVREGVIHDSGDQLGELPGYLRPHLELQCRHVRPPGPPGPPWLALTSFITSWL